MPIINGTAGNDNGTGSPVLSGTADDDTIHGFAGDDILNGDGGNDFLFGDEGADAIDGGVGGGAGDDSLADSAGSNTFSGGDGNDLITSTSASLGQSMNGEAGNDEIRLLAGGSSTVNGGIGSDRIVLENTSGNLLTGGADSDLFIFGAGSTGNVITDFTASGTSDTLRVISTQFSNYSGGNPFSDGHLRLVQDGSSTLVQIDLDGVGTGTSFVTLAAL
jgi:Ca2+-binding RTX toxin-like protein